MNTLVKNGLKFLKSVFLQFNLGVILQTKLKKGKSCRWTVNNFNNNSNNNRLLFRPFKAKRNHEQVFRSVSTKVNPMVLRKSEKPPIPLLVRTEERFLLKLIYKRFQNKIAESWSIVHVGKSALETAKKCQKLFCYYLQSFCHIFNILLNIRRKPLYLITLTK